MQPFNNYLVSMTSPARRSTTLLSQQFRCDAAPELRSLGRTVLQVGKGFAYTYSDTTTGSTVSDVKLTVSPIDTTATYRIVTNNFLSDGGDGFPAFRAGAGKYFGGLDIDAFANYLTATRPTRPVARRPHHERD